MNIKIKHLTPNEWSRPQRTLSDVRGLAIHWTANPNTSALFNWIFFEGKKKGESGYGSAHYIIGLDGEIVQAIPENEMAYHVGALQYRPGVTEKYGKHPNNHLIGIELCHPNWDGRFTLSTLQSATELCAALCRKYDLPPDSIVRHYDITGKDCPRWFVAHPEDFQKFRQAIFGLICLIDSQGEGNGI